MTEHDGFLPAIWAALGEDPRELARIAPGGTPVLGSALRAGALARDAIAAASLAAARLLGREGVIRLSTDRVATAVTSERHLRVEGERPDAWAELSGFWQARDGWVRSHANYPHHRSRLLAALDLPGDAPADRFAAGLAELGADEIERRAFEAGGIAVRVRETGELPLETGSPLIRITPGPAGRPFSRTRLRVLDLTRTIAGPVATRTLALLGADVLRIDPPRYPEVGWQHLDTGQGKRSAVLDVRADRARLDALLRDADVVVTGYRPGALDGVGLRGEDLVAAHPGLVVGRLSAWGEVPGWEGRRGFDSVVQAATGIARVESPDGRPGALPFQALDHASGYLLAAGLLSALRRRRETGEGALVEVALARTAAELIAAGPMERGEAIPFSPAVTAARTALGEVSYALPALGVPGGPDDWPAASRPWGGDEPVWADPS